MATVTATENTANATAVAKLFDLGVLQQDFEERRGGYEANVQLLGAVRADVERSRQLMIEAWTALRDASRAVLE